MTSNTSTNSSHTDIFSCSSQPQLLHWVFKIGNLKKNLDFLGGLLQCQIQRHEEFNEGCEAQCNGAYSRPWSKTMIGHGHEKDHFVFELTFNYGIKNYERGNDLRFIDVMDSTILPNLVGDFQEQLQDHKLTTEKYEANNSPKIFKSPDGYPFRAFPDTYFSVEQLGNVKSPVLGVVLNVSSLSQSLSYWKDVLGMTLVNHYSSTNTATLSYSPTGFPYLQLVDIQEPIHHKKAYGRIAITIPAKNLDVIEKKINEHGHKIHTPRVTLSTPGKADVDVIILSDPDDYEVCFVDSEGFWDLAVPTGDTVDWKYRKEMGD